MGDAVRTPGGGGKLHRISLGGFRYTKYLSVDMKRFVPERIWKKLTIENFGVVLTQIYLTANSNKNGTSGSSSYNAETGILSLYVGSYVITGDVPVQVIGTAYCWYVE